MPIRTFRVPDTRLPFVNGQIAQIKFKDQPHLVSAVWAGEDPGGAIYFWNPLTGSHDLRKLPEKIPGAYMVATGSDGRLYLGCGNGDLVRYDPQKDQMQVLVHGEMHSITWGGGVTDRHAVWSASPGDACIYDYREDKLLKKFSPVDTDEPHAHYGHNAVQAPDGKIILTLNTPQARLSVIDPEKLTAKSYTPPSLRGFTWIWNECFLDDKTLMLLAGLDRFATLLLRYPDFELIDRIDTPPGKPTTRKGAFVGGKFYTAFDAPQGTLFAFEPAARKWEKVIDRWLGYDLAYLGNFDNRYVCGITVRGRALTFDPQSAKTLPDVDVENTGQLDPHCFCAVPEQDAIVGAPFINSSFWTIDMKSGDGRDQGRAEPCSGQINYILWDAGRHRAYLAAYTCAAIIEYDPQQPTEWPKNPHVVASAESEQQMRPRAIAFDRRFVWMATGPQYGQLGGALSRVDPESREIKVWRNIIPDQTINSIVLDLKKHRVYIGSEIYADSDSAPATQKTAEVAAFDMATLKVLRRQPIRDGADHVATCCMLPDGNVLVREKTAFYSWNPDTGEVKSLGELPGVGPIISDQDDGTIWAAKDQKIGRLAVADGSLHFAPALDKPAGSLQIADGKMYWAWGKEIFEIPIKELIAG